jgi:hydrogenase 3 maturation protease
MDVDRGLLEQLEMLRGSRTLIIGIGSVIRGDDAAGPLICERLKSLKLGADIIDTGTVPENYIQPIIRKAPENLLIVDATDLDAPPGTVIVFPSDKLSSHAFSTHTLSPRFFVDMIKKEIDVEVYLLGIQPEHLELGQPPSDAVNKAVESICKCLADIFPPAI